MAKINNKSKYLLDSDVSIWILRNHPEIVNKVLTITQNKPFYISVLTVTEIYKNSREDEIGKYDLFFGVNYQLGIDYNIAKLAGDYWKIYKGVNQNIVDYLIAATCKVNKLILLTRNTKHFPMKDIKIIDPLSVL